MTNKTKKSKWLKLALISTASLSTLATIPAVICAKSTNSKTENKAIVKTSTPTLINDINAIEYVNVRFRIRPAEATGSNPGVITGKSVDKVKKGRRFAAVVKPEAKRVGYEFKGWSYSDDVSDENIISGTDPMSADTTVYAIFVPVGDITIKGKTTISMGESVTFTQTSTPEREVEWYATDKLTELSRESTSEYITASVSDGKIISQKLTEGHDAYVFAVRAGIPDEQFPTELKATDPNVLKVEVVDPTLDPAYADKIISKFIDGSSNEHVIAINPKQFYPDDLETEIEGDDLSTHHLPKDEQTPITINKNEFESPIAFGKNVTVIKDSFMSCPGEYGFNNFNNEIILTNVTHIGADFLADSLAFNQPIEFPSTLLTIDDGFLSGSKVFNNTITFAQDSNLMYIGNYFLSECPNFAQKITLPSSLKRVGQGFVYDTPKFHEIALECETDVFEHSADSFAIKSEDPNEKHEVIVEILTEGETFENLHNTFPDETPKSPTLETYLSRQLVGFEWDGQEAVIRHSVTGEFYKLNLIDSKICDEAGTEDIILKNDSETGEMITMGRDSLDQKVYLSPTLDKIPSGFLCNCTNFGTNGTSIEIPETVTIIGNKFLYGCEAYTADFTIPAGVTEIGTEFLTNAYAMSATITINCSVSVFKDSNTSFASSTRGGSHIVGIHIQALSDEEFDALQEKFYDLDGPDLYRKLVPAQ